jgi:hypothetical protein
MRAPMPVGRFSQDALLVGVRREVCPQAKSDKATRVVDDGGGSGGFHRGRPSRGSR